MEGVYDHMFFSRIGTEKGRCMESVEESYVAWVLERIRNHEE
jgi:hypothetical protein